MPFTPKTYTENSGATDAGRFTAADATRVEAGIQTAQATADAAQPKASLRDDSVSAVTGDLARVGLAIVVGYNDAGNAWPSLPASLTGDPNMAAIFLGGPIGTPPPTMTGPSAWVYQDQA